MNVDGEELLVSELGLSMEEEGEKDNVDSHAEVGVVCLVEDEEFLALISVVELICLEVDLIIAVYRKPDFFEILGVVVEEVDSQEGALLAEEQVEFLEIGELRTELQLLQVSEALIEVVEVIVVERLQLFPLLLLRLL